MLNILINKITLDKKELINKYLKNDPTGNSENTFTNLFMWQKSYNINYAEISNCLCIMSGAEGAKKQFSIIKGENGNLKEAYKKAVEFHRENFGTNFLIRLCKKNNLSDSLPEEFEILEELFPKEFHLQADRDNSDYVYEISALSQLKGKKYHSKRNFVNRFESNYNFVYQKMTPDFKDDCKTLYQKWYNEKIGSVPGLDEEREAVFKLLDNWQYLDIVGGCLKCDEKMVAFSFGEAFCGRSDMAVIHLEHADTAYVGAFPAINKNFLSNEWQNFKYVNREEDMGLEGLRKSKLSYYPCFLTEKFYAVHNLSQPKI